MLSMQLGRGIQVTLLVFVITILCALPLGLLLAFLLRKKIPVVTQMIQGYIWLMRGTPLLLQLIFIYYGLPLAGIVFSRMGSILLGFILNYAAYYAEIFRGGFLSVPKGQYEAAKVLHLTPAQSLRKIIIPQVFRFSRMGSILLGFILNYAAYYAEIFRGGFLSVPKGQYEAAKVLHLTPAQSLRKIIIPQVFRLTLPSVGNEIINLVKDTSLVSILGLVDVMRVGKIVMEREASFYPLIGVGIFYLVFTAVLTITLRYLEKRFSYEM